MKQFESGARTSVAAAGGMDASIRSIHQLFEYKAIEQPEAVALSLPDGAISYGELNARANRIARKLAKDFGLGAGQIAGLVLDRSIDAPAAALAILKLGAAYLPLDPDSSKEAIEFALKSSGAAVLIDNGSRRAGSLFFSGSVADPSQFELDGADATDLERPVSGAAQAYAIHIVDTMGVHESISASHDQALARFRDLDRAAEIEARPGRAWFALSGGGFELPLFEQLWALTRGLEIVCRRSEDALPRDESDNPFTCGQAAPLLSLFYWGSESDDPENRYKLLIEGCKFADENGLYAVWTPERHFHEFGGSYPNPSVTSAAIAAMTQNVKIRAGSVVIPLQEPIRVAEEWAVVDNFSQGRVGIAFASGWAANDFALAPGNHKNRKAVMMEGIDEFQRLWRGESVSRKTPSGEPIELRVFPRPVQRDGIPIWLTAAGSPDTFKLAGERGFGVLTLLQGQDLESLAEKIAIYREAWAANPANKGRGHVTLMLHTFLAEDSDTAREAVKGPLCDYLKSYIGLAKSLQPKDSAAAKAFEMDPSMEKTILERAFARYFESCGLLGSVPEALKMMDRLEDEGIDEVGCLIDFGLPDAKVFEGFKYLRQLKVANDARMARRRKERSLAGQLASREGAALRCEPGLLAALAAHDPSLEALSGVGQVVCDGAALDDATRHALAERGLRVSDFLALEPQARLVGEGLARCYAPSLPRDNRPGASEPAEGADPRASARRTLPGRPAPARRNALRRN